LIATWTTDYSGNHPMPLRLNMLRLLPPLMILALLQAITMVFAATGPEYGGFCTPERIANLCANAVKFTDRGGVSLQVRLQDADESQVTLTFAIEDSGIGISTDQQGYIGFTPG